LITVPQKKPKDDAYADATVSGKSSTGIDYTAEPVVKHEWNGKPYQDWSKSARRAEDIKNDEGDYPNINKPVPLVPPYPSTQPIETKSKRGLRHIKVGGK